MLELPPPQLVEMLERLGLASAAQVARMGRRVRRLARDLPQFESVWVDALAQARILTPYQAAELNAGRGQSLRVGPYVLCERLPHPHYVATYRARQVDSREIVRLAIIDNVGPRAGEILQQLESLVGCVKRTSEDHDYHGAFHAPYQLAPISRVGADGDRIFAAAPWTEGRTAAQWMIHHGRFPADVVLEIARAMLAGLLELEKIGVCHGDVSTSSLILTDTGGVALSMPGLRGILRPEEGYAHADLLPEAYDSLAPERISAGTPPNVRSDIYACGCVWWHLLCGRPPLLGGSSLAKLRAAQAAEICDVRRHAPDMPAPLAAAISACLEREPNRRPESMARLASVLGSPTRNGKEALADCLAQAGRNTVRWTTTVRSIRKSRRTPFWLAGAACCLVAAIAIIWPIWHGSARPSAAASPQLAAKHPGGRVPGSEVPHRKSGTSGQSADIPRPPSPNRDPSPPVVQAAYQQTETRLQDLVLAAERPQLLASLDLRPGQCVRGPTGKRATAVVPRSGLVIDKEGVRFENIDFVGSPTAAQNEAGATESALVQLYVSRAEFRGCSFQGGAAVTGRAERGHLATFAPAAIRWVHPAGADDADISLPSGRLQLADCVFYRVCAGVDCRTAGARAIELGNTLHLDAGPLVRLDHWPRLDEPVSIALSQVTLRGGGPLLDLPAPHVEEQPGEIAILSIACAFVPETGEPLVRFRGSAPTGRLLAGVRWTGQGSLVAPRVPVFAWREPDGRQQTADESALSIAGLVRSEVAFAGRSSGDPAASRLVRWQAPLQSPNPPGIDPAPLPNVQSGSAHRSDRPQDRLPAHAAGRAFRAD